MINVKFLPRRYAHLRDEALRQAANLAGDIISVAMTMVDRAYCYNNSVDDQEPCILFRAKVG